MKRFLSLLLIGMLIFSLAACSAKSNAEEPASAESTLPETQSPPSDDAKILVAYFSPANSDFPDSVSGATPRVGDASSVEYLAQLIADETHADLAKITPSEPYPVDYDETADQAKSEQDEDARPDFLLSVDPADYDVIFIGYPIWWYHMPMILQSFFDAYDLSGKTIIPFNTHAGSRDGGTYRDIEALEPNATVLEGLPVSGENAASAEKDVQAWLTRLGY